MPEQQALLDKKAGMLAIVEELNIVKEKLLVVEKQVWALLWVDLMIRMCSLLFLLLFIVCGV